MKCSTCRFWSAGMRTNDELGLGETAWCLRVASPYAATFVPSSNSCEEHSAGPPVDAAPALEAAE